MEKLFVLIMVTAVAVFISLPFFRGRLEEKSEEPDLPKNDLEAKLRRLNSEKESLLDAIKEIDLDYKLGKLSKEDYQELYTKYRTQAALILKEIDGVKVKDASTSMDEEIEREIKEVRKARAKYGRDLEKEILNAPRLEADDEQIYCTGCGSRRQVGDRFCSRCGARLN